MNKIFFHGSPKDRVQLILNQGIKTENGRAMFSINPLFTLKYGSYRFENNEKNINETIIYFIKNDGNIKPALESDIKLDKDNKTITGWPNRYRVNAYGYFSDDAKNVIPSDNILGAILFDKNLYHLLKTIETKTKGGILSLKDIEKAKLDLITLLQDKNIIVFKIMTSLSELADDMIRGLINQTVQSQIRKISLSVYKNDSWKIVNNGDHPIPIFDKEKSQKSLREIEKIIDESFIDEEIKQELNALKKISLT